MLNETRFQRIFQVPPFNTAGGLLLQAAIGQCTAGMVPATYGELVLHVAKQTSSDRVEKLIKSAFDMLDRLPTEYALSYIDTLNRRSVNAEFWRQSIDVALTNAGLAATEAWDRHDFPEHQDDFRNFQSLLFSFGVLNFVGVVLRDRQSKSFVEKALGKGLLNRLFG